MLVRLSFYPWMWVFERIIPWSWINTLLAPVYSLMSISPTSIGKFGFRWTFRAILLLTAVLIGIVLAFL